jgi:Mrp family chromosome partitioning ATPase
MTIARDRLDPGALVRHLQSAVADRPRHWADAQSGSERLSRPTIPLAFVQACGRALLRLVPHLDVGGVLAVTSPARREGRSLVAASVALAIARGIDEPVLLMDLDFERPRQHSIFGVPPSPGLTDFLGGESARPRIIGGGPDQLWLVPAGADQQNVMWAFQELIRRDLLGAFRQTFTWVVLDLPPVPEVEEAVLTARAADWHVVVGRHRSTTLAAVERTATLIGRKESAGFLMTSEVSSVPGWLSRLL